MGPAECLRRWERMVKRSFVRAQWHVYGLLLWLLRRPWLRYVPYPYPSVGGVDQWELQADLMVTNRSMSKKHLIRARQLKAFTAQNLQEVRVLRDRIGWEHSFVEDPMLEGMLLARHSKRVTAKLKAAALAESKQEAERILQKGQSEEAVRSILGPRGGLPSLKADLVKLCHVLHVEVDPKDTVEVLKGKIKPMIAIMKLDGRPPAKAKSSATAQASSPASPKQKPTSPSTDNHWSYPSSPEKETVTPEVLNNLMSQQEARFQSMLQQTMHHVMYAVQTGQPFRRDRE